MSDGPIKPEDVKRKIRTIRAFQSNGMHKEMYDDAIGSVVAAFLNAAIKLELASPPVFEVKEVGGKWGDQFISLHKQEQEMRDAAQRYVDRRPQEQIRVQGTHWKGDKNE